MLEDTMLKQHASSNIRIEDYILESFTAAKLTETYLDLNFIEQTTQELKISNALHAQLQCINLSFPFARSQPDSLPITNARVLVPAPNQKSAAKKVWELTLKSGNVFEDVELMPGDTIAILPSNSKTDVDFLLHAMQIQDKAEMCCSVRFKSNCTKKTTMLPPHVPPLVTPNQILRDSLNLRSVPKKQFLSALANYCSDALEQRFLRCLSSKEGAHFYTALILQQGLTFLDILRVCPTCCPTLPLLLEQLPRLLPRAYSIVNSPLYSKEIKIIFSVLPERPGVATSMLDRLCASLQDGGSACVSFYLRETNKFRFTSLEAANGNILIGVGTGVAPFLGFLEHKTKLSECQKSTLLLGDSWLFSGSKTHSSAFARTAFEAYAKDNMLQYFSEAFSRVSNSSRTYVQDLLLANCDKFVEFLMLPNTLLFVCADGAQISKSIETGVKQCLIQCLSLDATEATELIKELRNSGKYREDLWA